jgi:hypothetical protein
MITIADKSRSRLILADKAERRTCVATGNLLSTDVECVAADSQLPEHRQPKDRQNCCTETGFFSSNRAAAFRCKHAFI